MEKRLFGTVLGTLLWFAVCYVTFIVVLSQEELASKHVLIPLTYALVYQLVYSGKPIELKKLISRSLALAFAGWFGLFIIDIGAEIAEPLLVNIFWALSGGTAFFFGHGKGYDGNDKKED